VPLTVTLTDWLVMTLADSLTDPFCACSSKARQIYSYKNVSSPSYSVPLRSLSIRGGPHVLFPTDNILLSLRLSTSLSLFYSPSLSASFCFFRMPTRESIESATLLTGGFVPLHVLSL